MSTNAAAKGGNESGNAEVGVATRSRGEKLKGNEDKKSATLGLSQSSQKSSSKPPVPVQKRSRASTGRVSLTAVSGLMDGMDLVDSPQTSETIEPMETSAVSTSASDFEMATVSDITSPPVVENSGMEF